MRNWWRSTSTAALTACALAGGGCGNLSLGEVFGAGFEPERNAFAEHEFGGDTGRSAALEHIVALHLEPTGSHFGDTGEYDGVDEIPYEITETTSLGLGIPLGEDHGHWIELCDAAGKRLAYARDDHASSELVLEPGIYKVRVHHAGGVGAVPTSIFLRSTVVTDELGAAKPRSRDQIRGNTPIDLFCGGQQSPTGTIRLDEPTNTDPRFSFDRGQSRTLWVTGNLSCVTVKGLVFAAPQWHDVEASFRFVFKDGARNVEFENCRFYDLEMVGSVQSVTFTNCTLIDCRWNDGVTFSGGSVLDGCNLRTRYGLGGLDVGDATIRSCDFSGTRLQRSNLSAAKVTGCNFTSANFSSTNISSNTAMLLPAAANALTGALFAGVIAQDIDFRQVPLTSLALDWSTADLSRAKLPGQTLSTCNLTSTTFAGADLSQVICVNNPAVAGASFDGANLQRANFSGSNLTHAALDHASASSANFADCTLDNTSGHGGEFAYSNFSGATFAGAQFGGAVDGSARPATFSYAYLPNARITDQADFRNVDFSHAHFYGQQASVATSELTATNFTGAVVSGMDFSGATLESASFVNAQAVGTRFVGATLTDAKFTGAYLQGADFTDAGASGVVFVDAAISTGPCSDAADCSACGPAANCSFSSLNQAALCCYSFSDRDGSVFALAFQATTLPLDATIVCPNGDFGPCLGDALAPRGSGPFPAVPACVPSPFNWCPAPSAGE
ncbi:MAG: pentapeptide repeat-containing protein [Phycisphaerae bacterium]|nr:pentapeptide repeat-containing protein [Phycisphaerae bacterium]